MSRKLSKSDLAIKEAKRLGYKPNRDGEIFTPRGKLVSNKTKTKGGHVKLNLYLPGFNESGKSTVLWHRYVAYYFIGEEVFDHACVRHLDDNPENNCIDNLALGSYKDNRRDIPKDRLSEIARQHCAKGLVERNRKLSDEDIMEMRSIRDSKGLSYKIIAGMFGVAPMTAFRAINKQSWTEVGEC